MMIIKDLFLSLFVAIGLSGIFTVLFVNNPSSWYKSAKKVKAKYKEEKKRKKKRKESEK